MSTTTDVPTSGRVVFAVAPPDGAAVVRDYAGGLGFEADSGYLLPPLDLFQLAASLERAGRYEPFMVDGPAESLDRHEFLQAVLAVDPAIVVLSCTLPTLNSDQAALHALARAGIAVFARVHSTDDRVLEKLLDGSVVRCLTGECEDNLSDVLAGLDTRGTAVRADGAITVTPKPLIEELDDLPIPARHLARSRAYCFPKLGPCTTVLTSRGCPFKCRYYCPYPLVQGTKWRARSVPSVLGEIDSILALGIDRVLFRDPVFTLDVDRARQLCLALRRRGAPIRWWCETRADRLPGDLLVRMAEAGCKGINVGVESGDPRLRHGLLKTGVTDDLLAQLTTEGQRLGLKIAFLLMTGFPGETRQSVAATARLLSRCRPFSIGLVFPVHHPGTRFEKEARQRGWVLTDDLTVSHGAIPVLATPTLPAPAMITGRNLLLDHFRAISEGDAVREGDSMGRIIDWACESGEVPE